MHFQKKNHSYLTTDFKYETSCFEGHGLKEKHNITPHLPLWPKM